MKNFQSRDNKSGGYHGDRSDRRDEGRNRPSYNDKRGGDREVTMFQATCSECKKNCDVPFRPSNDKPVYCNACFNAKRERDDKEYKSGSFNREPKRFSNDRPVFRADFVRPEFKPVSVDDSTKKQLVDISFKLDKLINVIEKMSVVKKEVVAQAEMPVKAFVKVSPVVVEKPKVFAKKVVTKAVEVKKVAPKVMEVKKIVAKKAVAKVVVKTVAKKVAVKKTR